MSEKVAPSIQDQYVAFPPSYSGPFDLFKGEWASQVPGYTGGFAALFDDFRVNWLGEQAGGFAGKRILELGPLEGGHTYMMARAGGVVTSIEANIRAFMKCLIVKNALKFDAELQLGDFRPYLATTPDRFDFLLMSGVLYHMTAPVKLMTDCMRVADSIGVWTHYYDAGVINANPAQKNKFKTAPHYLEHNGKKYETHEQRYDEALAWNGFCGGSEPNSYWLTRESLLGLMNDCGFDVTLGAEDRKHPHGPCILFYAKRRGTA